MHWVGMPGEARLLMLACTSIAGTLQSPLLRWEASSLAVYSNVLNHSDKVPVCHALDRTGPNAQDTGLHVDCLFFLNTAIKEFVYPIDRISVNTIQW